MTAAAERPSLPTVVIGVSDPGDRRRLTGVIVGELGWTVSACAPTGAMTVSLAESLQPRVLLLSLGLPDLHGHEAASVVRSRAPRTVIVVFGRRDQEVAARLALRFGAVAMLRLDHSDLVLATALYKLAG